MSTGYDDAVGYDAAVPYNGSDIIPPSPDSGGFSLGNLRYITTKKPRKPARKYEEELALIAWFEDDAN